MLQNNYKNISNVPGKQKKVTKLRPILKSCLLVCLIYTNAMMYLESSQIID